MKGVVHLATYEFRTSRIAGQSYSGPSTPRAEPHCTLHPPRPILNHMPEPRARGPGRQVENAILAISACAEGAVPITVTFEPPLGTYDARSEIREQTRTVSFTVRADDFDSIQARLGGGG